MRIDMEQFLAITMLLGTAGAIGAAVIVSQRGDEAPAAAVDEVLESDDEEIDVAVRPTPEPTPAPVVAPAPELEPPLPEEPDADFLADPELDGIPAPHIEGWG